MASINRTIREQVTNQIRDEVVTGLLAAGSPLREEELAERFGVSRGPVRDAFLQLSQEGFLAYEANRGVRVRNPPDDANREFIVSIRRQIECFVVQNGVKEISDESLQTIQSALDDLQIACDSKQVAQVAKADIAFHQSVIVGCGGDDFFPIWKWLCSQMMMSYARLEDYQDVVGEHAEILEGLKNRRKQATLVALRKNIC